MADPAFQKLVALINIREVEYVLIAEEGTSQQKIRLHVSKHQ